MKRWVLGLVAVLAVLGLIAWQAGWLVDLGFVERGAPGEENGRELSAASPDGDPAAGAMLEGREAGKPLAPTPPPITGPRISGRVVDPAGRGVAGARVLSLPDTNVKTAAFEDYAREGAPGHGAIADAEGRFVVAVSTDAPYHFVAASAPGFALALVPDLAPGADVVLALEPMRALTGTVKDKEGTPVVGARIRALLLVDAIKVERETKSVEAGAYRLEGLPPDRKKLPSGWSGFNENGWIEVTADEFAPLFVEVHFAHTAGALPPRDFTLSRGATILGTVQHAETGKPIPSATVSLHSVEGMQGFGRRAGVSFMNPYGPRVLVRTQADENGSFRIEHVPCAGPHPASSNNMLNNGKMALGGVAAWAAGFAAAAADVEIAADGATLEVTLKLWPAATITGRVTSADGKPVVDVNVLATVEGREARGYVPAVVEGAPSHWAKSAPDGGFRMGGVPVGESGPASVLVRAFQPNRGARTKAQVDGEAKLTVTLKAGEVLDVGDLVLAADDPQLATTVRVIRPDGTPYFGASVMRGGWHEGLRTDAEGKAAWTWTKPKEGQALPSVDVVVTARGFAPTPATLHPPGSGREIVEVVLLPAHRLRGSVTNADGTPAAGVPVLVADGATRAEEVFLDRGNQFTVPSQVKGRALPVIYGNASTAEDGTFTFEDLPDGPYHVRATKARRVAVGPNAKALAALLSGVAADSEVVLRLPMDDSPATGSLKVTVTEMGTGKAVPGVRVLVKRGADVVASAQGTGGRAPGMPGTVAASDPSGAQTVPVVPVGTYVVEVSAEGFRTARVPNVEVRADIATTVPAIALDRGIVVVGRVVPPAGHTLSDRTITFRSVESVDGRGFQGPLGADGTFRVTGFDPGRYWVTVDGDWFNEPPPPFAPAGGEELVLAAGETEVRFDVTWAAAALIGIAPDDPRLPSVVWDGDQHPNTPERARFGAATRASVRGPDGRVHLDVTGVRRGNAGSNWRCVLPGRYVARIEFPEGEVREETVDLVVGDRKTIRFRKR